MTLDRHRKTHPRTFIAAAACAAVLSLPAATARAATVASGFLWSENAERMVCFVWNVSNAPLKVLSTEIVDDAGNAVTSYDNCVAQPVQPGKRCGFLAYDVTQAGGRVTIEGPRGRVRGTCQLLAPGSIGITTSDLR
jgi:hypothetical protein